MNHEHQPLSPAATPRQLRLFCVLVEHSDGTSQVCPVNTLHPVPPRRLHTGKWPLVLPAGLVLRETHAVAPSTAVLARCARLRQANPIRSTARATA